MILQDIVSPGHTGGTGRHGPEPEFRRPIHEINEFRY